MLIAFQGGDVHAELIGSALYLKARDLLAILELVTSKTGSSGVTFFNNVRHNTNIILYNNIIGKTHLRAPLYISINDVTTFLDNIHIRTQPKTIQLMLEVMQQFKSLLKA